VVKIGCIKNESTHANKYAHTSCTVLGMMMLGVMIACRIRAKREREREGGIKQQQQRIEQTGIQEESI
jgi:hypothetical protein